MGKITIIVLIVAAIAIISGMAYARYQGYCCGPEGKANWLVDRISKQLDLDEQQHQQLSLLRDKALALSSDIRSNGPQQIEHALQLLDTPQLDREQAYRIWQEKHSLLAAAGPQMIDAFADFSDSLNDTQRIKLQHMITQHRSRHHGHYCCSESGPVAQE